MNEVFLVWHVHDFGDGNEDDKLIGVYRTRENAEAAIKRIAGQPGFVDQPNGFQICPYVLDMDHWTEGYITLPDSGQENYQS
jgi:hypothetical protein